MRHYPLRDEFQLNHPQFDASAQHKAPAQSQRYYILEVIRWGIEFTFARSYIRGKEISSFGLDKRPIRMSTTLCNI